MSTPSTNWTATTTPVTVASGRNLFPRVTTGSVRSSLRGAHFFKAYGTTNGTTSFSAGASSETTIILSAVDESESSGAYDATTGVYTAPVKGLYSFDVSTTDSSRVNLKVTSAGTSYYPASGGHGFTCEIPLEAGDEVRFTVYDGTSIDVTDYPSPFSKGYLVVSNLPDTTIGGRLVLAL